MDVRYVGFWAPTTAKGVIIGQSTQQYNIGEISVY
jgi:hypothetical protein